MNRQQPEDATQRWEDSRTPHSNKSPRTSECKTEIYDERGPAYGAPRSIGLKYRTGAALPNVHVWTDENRLLGYARETAPRDRSVDSTSFIAVP